MAFFRWGGPSVRLGFIRFTPEKAPEKSIEPAVTPVVAAGSFVFGGSSAAIWRDSLPVVNGAGQVVANPEECPAGYL